MSVLCDIHYLKEVSVIFVCCILSALLFDEDTTPGIKCISNQLHVYSASLRLYFILKYMSSRQAFACVEFWNMKLPLLSLWVFCRVECFGVIAVVIKAVFKDSLFEYPERTMCFFRWNHLSHNGSTIIHVPCLLEYFVCCQQSHFMTFISFPNLKR